MSKKQLGTPVMRQFWEMKKNNPDSILLFRMGDFYETFEEDAKTTSNILGIALTKRSNGAAADVPLAGFPYHALDQYLHKLLSNGHRVAICEQVEDPKEAKGIVKREVVEIASPGTSISAGYLKDGENNYLASIVFSKNRFGLSILDYSTGEFRGLELSIDNLDQIISQYNVKELVISESQFDTYHHIISKYDLMISKVPNWYLDVKISNDYLKEHFNLVTLKGFGIENQNLLIKSAALALDYVNKNYCGKVNHIINYKKINDSNVMILDGYTVKNLEIFKSISSGNNSGTLISSIDKTKTSAGSRLLKKIISRPLTDINKINIRLDRIEELNKNLKTRDFIIDKLEECSDLGEAFAAVALRIQGEQKTLLKHLEREFSRIDPMAGQVALYMTMVCVRVFEDGGEAGSVLRRVNQTSIDEATRAVRAQQAAVLPIGEGFVERAKAAERSQPHLLDEVLWALYERDDDELREQEADLSDVQKVQIYFMLWIAVEALNRKWRPAA